MNTTMTAVSSTRNTERVRQRARLARERVAIRVGLALVAWGRRTDARLTHEAVAERRRRETLASELRDGTYTGVSLRTRSQ